MYDEIPLFKPLFFPFLRFYLVLFFFLFLFLFLFLFSLVVDIADVYCMSVDYFLKRPYIEDTRVLFL